MGDAPPPLKEHILCTLPYPEPHGILDRIRKRHPNATVTYKQITFERGKSMLLRSLPEESWKDVTILITLATFPDDVQKAPHLKLVHLFSAGTDSIYNTPIWKSDVPLTNSSGIHGPQIAEYVLMQILNNSHKNHVMIEWQKQHVWGMWRELGDIKDSIQQRLGIWGYGAIGRQTARICKAMGMDVIAYTATPRTTPESRKDHGYVVPGTGDADGLLPSEWYSGTDKASLHRFLSANIDFLLVSVPLTPLTHHALGAEEFAILSKRNAFVINVARGAIIKTSDLVASLKKGELRGAALDVTEPEPLPADSELWDLKNLIITPHVSGLGTTYEDRSFAIFEENLENLEKGRPLINLVSREKGY